MKVEVLDGGGKAGGILLLLAIDGIAVAGIVRRNPLIADDTTPTEQVEVDKFFNDHRMVIFPAQNSVSFDAIAIPRQKLEDLANRWAR
jgi:hypothetical protein